MAKVLYCHSCRLFLELNLFLHATSQADVKVRGKSTNIQFIVYTVHWDFDSSLFLGKEHHFFISKNFTKS